MMDSAAAAFGVERAGDPLGWTANTVGSPTEHLFGPPDPWGGYSILDAISGVKARRVSAAEAIRQTAVLICLDVLAQDVAKAPLRLERKVKGKSGAAGWVEVDPKKHPVAEMLALEPNRRHTWTEWASMTVMHLALSSNSYSIVMRDRYDTPLALLPATPGQVDQYVAASGDSYYDVFPNTEADVALFGFQSARVREADMMHVRRRMVDGFSGYSTLDAGADALARGRAIAKYGLEVYESGGERSGYFSRDSDKGEMTDPVFNRVKQQLRILQQRRRDGDVALLEDGIVWKELAASAKELEYMAQLDAQITDICRLFRVPPHKALHMNAVKYENLTTMERAYANDTLVPVCEVIEARAAKTLLTRKERLEYRFRFDRDSLIIADEKLRLEEASKLFQAGVLTKNEARNHMGWNPVDGGDVYNLPANTSLVDSEFNVVATGASKTPEPGSGEGDEPVDEENTGEDAPAVDPEDKSARPSLRIVA